MNSAALPIVVVGTGFGWTVQVPSLRAAGFDVVALVGQNPARTAERAQASGVANWFTDLDRAISETGTAAVAIATPPSTHAPLTMAALERGCHVLCEKPFAMNVQEARAMRDAADHAGVTHVVGYEFRWAPERALIARAIVTGLIGEPRFLTLVQYTPLVAGSDDHVPAWFFEEKIGGGWLGASGSHVIDQVRTWVGEFESLSAALPSVSCHNGAAEDSYVVRFRSISGVEGVLQQTGAAWGEHSSMARVAGTHGTVWSEGSSVWIADRHGTRRLSVPEDLELPPPPASTHEDACHRYAYLQIGPYTRLCEAFRAAIEGRSARNPVNAATFDDGVICTELIDAIRRSAVQGGALLHVSSPTHTGSGIEQSTSKMECT